MRVLTGKDGDFFLNFDEFSDGISNASINNTSSKEMLIDNHTELANKGKSEVSYP